MISIGIAMVGLLGALALMPVAGSLARKGLNADRMARVGINAIEEFDIRGYRNPALWVRRVPAGLVATNPLVDSSLAGQAFCIDPRFYAVHTTNGSHRPRNATDGGGLAVGVEAALFPFYMAPLAAEARMLRVGLLRSPGVPLPLEWATGSPARYPTNSLVPAQMTLLQANDIFSGRDDLAFRQPDDDTLPPQQVFSPVPNPLFGTTDVARREYDAQLTWLATVAPKTGAANTDLYTLSVVVFYQRNSGFPLPRATDYITEPRIARTERLANVSFEGGPANYARKDLVLQTRAWPDGSGWTIPMLDAAKSELQVQENDWLMLSAKSPSGAGLFRWYRVIDAEPELTFLPDNGAGVSVWGLRVTIDGPDWLPHFQSYHTQATLVTGVIGVFEKTIRLESTSLWW